MRRRLSPRDSAKLENTMVTRARRRRAHAAPGSESDSESLPASAVRALASVHPAPGDVPGPAGCGSAAWNHWAAGLRSGPAAPSGGQAAPFRVRFSVTVGPASVNVVQ